MSTEKIYETLDALPDTGTPGELVYIQDLNKIYTYSEEQGWEEFDTSNVQISGLTTYDINKMVIEKLPDLAHKQIKEAKKLIRQFVNQNDLYFMLLCNEKHSYTVFELEFVLSKQEIIEDVVIEVLEQYGTLRSVNYNEDKTAIECWLNCEDGIHMFLFFPYDWGVIRCV